MAAQISPFRGWDRNMRAFAETGFKQAESALRALEVQAADIVSEFREQRESLQKEAQAELAARTPMGRRPKSLYAPLNLFCRVRDGGLQLYWQEVHRHRITHRTMFRYLRVNSDGDGDLRLIMARAREFETALVRDTELEARRLRAQWSRWSQIRRECLRAYEMIDRGSSAASADEAKAEWVPAADTDIAED